MIVGFWNVQRATGPLSPNVDTHDRATLCAFYVNAWIKSRQPPDLLFLAEVNQSGESFAEHLGALALNYAVAFKPVRDVNGNVSPCSFLVMAKDTLGVDLNDVGAVQLIGASTRRPAVKVKLPSGKCLMGVHVIAVNRAQALSEIKDFCNEMANEHQPVLIIGDMNYPWSDLQARDADFENAGFRSIWPGLEWTHKRGNVLDYAWANKTMNATATPPDPRYPFYDVIDHAPIAYEVAQWPVPPSWKSVKPPVPSPATWRGPSPATAWARGS